MRIESSIQTSTKIGEIEMKVALYDRVSTSKQDAEKNIAILHDFCTKMGWEVYKEYVDVTHGYEESRPSWDLLFKEAHQKKYDLVLFWAYDRFSRSGARYTLQKLHELDLLDIGYKSYTEQYIDTVGMFKDVVISIISTVAKSERERIVERTRAGLKCKCGHSRAVHTEACQKCDCTKFRGTGKRGKDKRPRSRKGYFK